MQISPHFSLEELTASETAVRHGIDNTPSPEVIEQLRILCAGLEEIRYQLGEPIHINSGYRCAALNAAVAGAAHSQHVTGNAADFICPSYGTPLMICGLIAESTIEFDQLIYEMGSWVHVSFVESQPRRSVLTIRRPGAGYLQGLIGGNNG